ncbi:MAG: efflux RND transporter periplasmic adaptor subunit [Deltaproteobacteria bacterium]|nr:efflux RND transporter periplasmic adaptor subunit [Deltaproteobacteria bacterium]
MKRMLMLSVAASLACGGAGRDSEARIAVVERGEVSDRVLLTGSLEAIASNDLMAPATPVFRLNIQFLADDGSEVKKGDKVVEFDNSQLSTNLAEKEQAVLTAANDLAKQNAQSRVTLADKRFDVLSKRVALDKAKLDAAIPADTLARRTYQEYQLALTKAESAHEQARADLATQEKTAALDRQIKELAYQKAERDYLSSLEAMKKLVLVAPQDGIVVIPDIPWEGRKLQVGDDVWPGRPVAKFPDLRAMKVMAVLSDVDDGRVAIAAEVGCRLDAFPDRVFKGKVKSISPVANEVGKSELRRQFDVEIVVDDSDAEIMRPGMSVLVEVAGPNKKDVLLVPRAAIVSRDGSTLVELDGGKKVGVDLGVCGPMACEVHSGIAEGDRVVVGGEG